MCTQISIVTKCQFVCLECQLQRQGMPESGGRVKERDDSPSSPCMLRPRGEDLDDACRGGRNLHDAREGGSENRLRMFCDSFLGASPEQTRLQHILGRGDHAHSRRSGPEGQAVSGKSGIERRSAGYHQGKKHYPLHA